MTDPKLQDSSGGHAGSNAQRTTGHNNPQAVVGPQGCDEPGRVGHPAPFRVCPRPTGSELMLFGVEPESLAACDAALLGDLAHARFGLEDARAIVSALNRVAAVRRGDSPVDVQRQLLEELRELVKLQRTSLTKMTSVVEDQLALQREAMGKAPRGEVKRPERNVNDLMIEVARGFGLSDATSRSIGDLKGFCAAAMEMASVPEAAKEPLLRLAVRGVFGDVKALGAKLIMESMGLDLG